MSVNLLNRRALLAALASLPAYRVLSAQQPQSAAAPQQQPTFSADVKVVNVFATVRDKKGQIVKDLSKGDFTLMEDGRPQTIKYFAKQSDLPLTLGLLVDTSRSERRMIPTEKSASYKFFEQVLRPDRDKAFLLHFDHEVELLQDLTASREKLEKSLELLAPSEGEAEADRGGQAGGGGGNNGGGGYPGGGGGGMGYPGGGGMGRHGGGGYPRGGGGGGHRSSGGTKLYDGMYLAADELLSKQTGRKAMILLTDGEDNGSKTYLEEAIGSVQKADTVSYAVRITDEEIGSMVPRGWNNGGGGRGGGGADRPDGKKILKQISSETGGAYYEYGKKKPLEDIYSEIQDELRNQYSIGYTSDHTGDDRGFRKIELTVSEKGYVVQARKGYYA
jgi:VWFA-related protein